MKAGTNIWVELLPETPSWDGSRLYGVKVGKVWRRQPKAEEFIARRIFKIRLEADEKFFFPSFVASTVVSS